MKETTQHNRELRKVSWITKGIFWIAFAALLATSIPHVAWVYQAFEPKNSNMLNLWFTTLDITNLTSTGIAVGIDVMAAWLTYTITFQGKKGNTSLWLFIGVLVVFSWYCNYLYAMAHNPESIQDVWSINLWFTTTGEITPVLISAVPVLVIAYTLVWEQIGKQDDIDPVKLAEQATLLEQMNEQKRRIRNAKRVNRLDTMKGFFADTKAMIEQASIIVKRDGQGTGDSGEHTETVETKAGSVTTNNPTNLSKEQGSLDKHTDKLVVIEPSVTGSNTLKDKTEVLSTTNANHNGHAPFIPPYRRKV